MIEVHTQWNPTVSQWESGIKHFPEANFLQSYSWGEFNQQMDKKVLRLQITDGKTNAVVGQASMVIEDAKRGRYMAIAGGPLVDWKNQKLVKLLFAEIRTKAKSEKCTFIRFRPQTVGDSVPTHLLSRLQVVEAPMHLTADLTLQLDLSLSEDQLLMDMRKNTRSAIRKAERIGITTTVSTDPDDITCFYEEERKVAERQGFIPFSFEFLDTQFRVFLDSNQVLLVHSHSPEGDLLASAFVIFYNGEAVYHYGISTEHNTKLPGSYACQWRAILEAKERGCTRYNFWGIAPKDETDHRFAGVSLFKRGFGGEEVPYLEAQDIPLSVTYWVTYVFEFIRKKYRRL